MIIAPSLLAAHFGRLAREVERVNSAGADSYPIAGFTYLLVYDDLSYIKDKNVAKQTLDFIMWCETDGQKMAEGLGYAQLPKDAADKVIEKIKSIKFDGETLVK